MRFAPADHSGAALSEAVKARRDSVCSSLPRVERLMDYVRFIRPEPNRPTKPITIK